MPGLICIHLLRRTSPLLCSNDIHSVLLGVGVATILHHACPSHFHSHLKPLCPLFFHRFWSDWNKEIQNADRGCLQACCNALQSAFYFPCPAAMNTANMGWKMSHHHHHHYHLLVPSNLRRFQTQSGINRLLSAATKAGSDRCNHRRRLRRRGD